MRKGAIMSKNMYFKPLLPQEEIRRMSDDVLKEWKNDGGLIHCEPENFVIIDGEIYRNPSIFVLDDYNIYKEWLFDEGLTDSTESQKKFCRIALKECGVYSDEEIEQLLEWD